MVQPEFEYMPGSRVTIVPIEAKGVVCRCAWGHSGIEYLVEYWLNSKPESAWCFPDDLDPINYESLLKKRKPPTAEGATNAQVP